MWNDEIVEETRQLRDRYAAKFDYDLDRDLLRLEETGARSREVYLSATETA
jgi:hypothetical protein